MAGGRTPNQNVKCPLLVDLHCDSLLAHVSGERDLRQRSSTGHVDLPRLRQAGVNGQVFAVWVDPQIGPAERRGYVERHLGALAELCADPGAGLRRGLGPADISLGQVAAIAAVEGGHALGGEPAYLDRLYSLGVRILTVTWCNSNELADGGWDQHQPHNGLSALGREAVRRMNRLGIIVDVSHCSEKAFFDILAATTKPVIASHSGAAAIHQPQSRRNLSDEQLRHLAANRGVVGAVFVPAFLGPAEGARADISDVVRHIDHIVQLIGPDHVAIGSDFDGYSGNLNGLEDCTRLPDLLRALGKLGYPEAAIAGIAGGNFLRVWTEVAASAE